MVSHGISPALKKTLIKVGMGHSKVPRMWCDGEVECLFLSVRSLAQLGRAPALGAGSRWFESSISDHYR
jgi:hypothetical protein